MASRSLSEDRDFAPPLRPYRVTIQPMNLAVEVRPERAPFARIGRPGSLLDVLLALAPQAGLEHLCGGHGSCTTCRVVIAAGLEACNPRLAQEEETLAQEGKPTDAASRLACQCVPTGASDLVIQIPPRRA